MNNKSIDLKKIKRESGQPQMWVGKFNEKGKQIERLVVACSDCGNPTVRQRICRVAFADIKELNRLAEEKGTKTELPFIAGGLSPIWVGVLMVCLILVGTTFWPQFNLSLLLWYFLSIYAGVTILVFSCLLYCVCRIECDIKRKQLDILKRYQLSSLDEVMFKPGDYLYPKWNGYILLPRE